MSAPTIVIRLTFSQADALTFACGNALVEPANFERGSAGEHTKRPMRQALDKIHAAIVDAKAKP